MKLFPLYRTLFVLFLVVVCLVACKSPAVTTTSEVEDRIIDTMYVSKETVRYDTIKIPGDSIRYEVMIECDSITNKPKPVRAKVKSGKSALDVTLTKDGLLNILYKQDSLVKVIQSKDREITRLKEHIRTERKKETVVITKCKAPWYDLAARWIAVVTILFIIYKLKKQLPV